MHRRHLIDTKALNRPEIECLISVAHSFLTPSGLVATKFTDLQNTRLALAFFEPSTRTRISFETAIQRLGGSSIHMQSVGSSVEKGESLLETIHTLNAMSFDGLIIRHGRDGAVQGLSEHFDVPIVNAGEGTTLHPTQALLDVSTLVERFGKIDGLKICIVGDVQHSRVARSNVDVFVKLGAVVTICCPSEFEPTDDVFEDVKRVVDIQDALSSSDVVNLLRIQKERIESDTSVSIEDYRKKYSVTTALAERYPDVVLIHPGPANEGVEIESSVLNRTNCLIHRQVTHGVAMRMAVLKLLFESPN